MARPTLKLDEELIKKLASIHCTMKEIANIVGCSVDTLEEHYADIIKEAKDKGKMSLRRHMWEAAQNGNVTMMIWLSKNILGYRDRIDTEITMPKPTIIKRINGEVIEVGIKQIGGDDV